MGNRRRRNRFRDSRAVPGCERVRRRCVWRGLVLGLLLRRGIFRPRFGWARGTSAGALTGAVGLHRVGNSSRLPGWVV